MERSQIVSVINNALEINPVVAILGPRQCGKTTLARCIGTRISGVHEIFGR